MSYVPQRPRTAPGSRGVGVQRNTRRVGSPRVFRSLKFACNESYSSGREQDTVSAALIQYAETEMLSHVAMLENSMQVDHTLHGFHVLEDATTDRATEKRAIMLAPKVFSKPLTAVEALKRRLHEAPANLHSREAKAYYKSISRKLDAYFSTKGKIVEMPPPKLIQVLNKNADLAHKQTEDHGAENAWKRHSTKFKLRTKKITSILAEQEKDWQNRKIYDHISVPSFTVNAVPHKNLVDFDKVRQCNLEIEHSEPIKDRFLSENHGSKIKKSDHNTTKCNSKYRKNMFAARSTSSAPKVVLGDTTKNDLIKEVRARKYRGGGIRLSHNDIFNPKYTFRKVAMKHRKSKRIPTNIETAKGKKQKQKECISPKDKILRKIMQTKEEFYKNVENSVRKSIKISLGGIRGASGAFGPSLENCKIGQGGGLEGRNFTISYPSPFASIETNDCIETSAQREQGSSRMPPYFEIDKDQLNSFFNKTGDLLRNN